MMQLEVRDYLNMLRRRWWLIVLVAVVAAGAGYGVSKLQPPVYQAAAKLVLKPGRDDNGLILYAKQIITTYPLRLQSRDFISKALAASDDPSLRDDDPQVVLNGLKVQVVPDSLTINMTQDDPNGAHAAALLNTISAAFVELLNGEEVNSASADKVFLVQSDLAQPPSQPYQPRPTLTAGAAGLLGAVLGLVLAFALELLDDTLKTTDDIQHLLGLSTVGLIPARK